MLETRFVQKCPQAQTAKGSNVKEPPKENFQNGTTDAKANESRKRIKGPKIKARQSKAQQRLKQSTPNQPTSEA